MSHWFWELMMVVYYGYLFPLSMRIRQGFYENGVWAGPAFVPYADIGSLTWREEPQITLAAGAADAHPGASSRRAAAVLCPGAPVVARPDPAHQIHLSRPGWTCFGHDDRDDV